MKTTKTTKATRKLSLSRETLRALDTRELARAAGGVSGTPGCNCSLGQCTLESRLFYCVPETVLDVA